MVTYDGYTLNMFYASGVFIIALCGLTTIKCPFLAL